MDEVGYLFMVFEPENTLRMKGGFLERECLRTAHF